MTGPEGPMGPMGPGDMPQVMNGNTAQSVVVFLRDNTTLVEDLLEADLFKLIKCDVLIFCELLGTGGIIHL